MRAAALVLPAAPEDLDDLVELSLAGRGEVAAGVQVCTSDPERLRTQLATLLGAPGSRVLVARLDDRVTGMLLARVVGPTVFSDAVNLEVEALYVRSEARRRGVGRALLTATAEIAAAEGASDIYCVPMPGARSMQRFLARLGFSPAAAHRVVSTAALQRRLTQDGHAAPRRSAKVREVLEARRQARAARSMQVNLPVATLRPDPSTTITS
ncbi:GNAT family N-acetyltransferase [Cellulomonas endophytica]|uniref:GNAT family N-acetyltransferase n=1 Tax=Cellulomonas endophytica TaxID=2494735 RepID=UPI001F0CAD23|nr:GNAT family N-acetyltransferase [Cellulomonas endophytica]